MIPRICLVLALLAALASAQVAKKCLKANKAYEGQTLKRPAAPSAAAKCDMYTEEDGSCCNVMTEYYMAQKAKVDFPTLALSRVVGKLRRVQEVSTQNNLTPVVVSEQFNELVQRRGSVTYEELTRAILGHYLKEECISHPYAIDLVGRLTRFVKTIADYLSAVYEGLATIQKVLEMAAEFKISTDCETAVMQNGLYTGPTFEKSMCQVCNRNYAIMGACASTCKNVARGCLNELTDVNDLLNQLILDLDAAHFQLLIEAKRDGSLLFIDQDITTYLNHYTEWGEQCSSGRASPYVADNSLAQSANFSGAPLELQDLLEKSADYACLLSISNENCWTAEGVTESDLSYLFNYDSASQKINTKVRRPEVVSEAVATAENDLREGLRYVRRALTGYDLFAYDADVVVPEETEEETEMEEEEETGEEPDETEPEITEETETEDDNEEETEVEVEPEVEDETEVETEDETEVETEDETEVETETEPEDETETEAEQDTMDAETDAGEGDQEESDMGDEEKDMGDEEKDMGDEEKDMGDEEKDMEEEEGDMGEGEGEKDMGETEGESTDDDYTVDGDDDNNVDTEEEEEEEVQPDSNDTNEGEEEEELDTTETEGASTADSSALHTAILSTLLSLVTIFIHL